MVCDGVTAYLYALFIFHPNVPPTTLFADPFESDTFDKILGFTSETGGHEHCIKDLSSVESMAMEILAKKKDGDLVTDFVYNTKLFVKFFPFPPCMVLYL